MTERRERDFLTARAEIQISALYRPLARAVGQSLRQRGTQPLSWVDHARIMAEVDLALSGVYGRFPNDRSAPLYRLVVHRCIDARRTVFAAAVAMVRKRLPADLLAVIEGDTA